MRLSRSFALPLRPPARTEMRPGPPFAFGRNGLHSRSPGCVLLLDRCGLSAKDSPSVWRATRFELEMTEKGWRARRVVKFAGGVMDAWIRDGLQLTSDAGVALLGLIPDKRNGQRGGCTQSIRSSRKPSNVVTHHLVTGNQDY